MIKCFIDENTGKSEILDVLRFEDNQSIGLYYQKRVFFMSDSNTENISLDGDGTVFLYDTSVMSEYLSDMIKMSLVSTGTYYTTGTYLHYINLGSKSDTIGDYNCNLKIGDNTYTVNATFWGDREENRVLLHNFGTDIPTDVSRALYEGDVHSLTPDYLLLNRKYKELLLNYLDILGNKGSYKSLQNSLDWFEYGEFASLKEFWSTPEKVKLYQSELTDTYSEVLKEIISMYTKTTFIAIEYNLNAIVPGEYDVEDGQSTVPLTKEVITKWAVDDMMLKMTLLGNYFSTFFMPLHLNLLYSTVVDIVFPSPAKAKIHTGNGTLNNIYKYNDFRLISKLYDEYVVGDIKVGATAGTPAAAVSPTGRLGVVPLSDVKNEDADDGTTWYKEFENNLTVGSGVVVPMEFEAARQFVAVTVRVGDDAVKVPVDFKDKITLYIFIKTTEKSAKKTIYINFIDDEGYISSKSYDITVSYPNSDHFTFNILKFKDHEIITANTEINRALSFEQDEYENRDKLYYPDRFLKYITAVKEGPMTLKVGDDEFTGDYTYDTLYMKLSNDYPGKFALLSRGTFIYIVSKTELKLTVIDNSITEKTGEVPLDEKRLIPSLYEIDPNGNPADVDNLIQLVPDDIYVNLIEDAPSAWIVTNETTGESNIIKNTVTPIIWGTGKESDNYSGTYSVSLAVKYGDITVTHTRDKIWRIKSNVK